MSQKDQEAAIDEKIERIRKRNEEIKRRHLEVEADKMNAEKLNAAVKFTPSETKITERIPFSRPPAANRNPRFEKKVPDKPYTAKPAPQGKKFANFTDGDGPPPDPVYTFLSDHSRDNPRDEYSPSAKNTRENSSDDEMRGQRGRGRGRGWSRGRGNPMRGNRRGGNSGNQFSRQGPQLQPEYQAWRAEREKIDQDRITRQKTAEGNWRREWDSEKLSQDEKQEYQARPSFSKKKKRDSEDIKIQRTVPNELVQPSPPSKENVSRSSDKFVKSDSHIKGIHFDKKSVAFTFREGASCNETNSDDLEEPLGFEHRNIISCGDSIKISLSNKPIRSVKVNPVSAAGTGRVGPRQKPLLSYSSQSEDEKEIHSAHYHRRAPPKFSPKEAAPLPPRDEASSKKPPLPPSRGVGYELGSPRKKPAATKVQPTKGKEVESQAVERKELSRESSHENVSEGGDDSWEDVATTSGNESADCSDVDVKKKPDSIDRSVSKDRDLDDGSTEETPKIVGTPYGECGKLSEGDGAEQGESCEETDGFDDAFDEEAGVPLSEEDNEAAEEDTHSDVGLAAHEECDESSLEAVGAEGNTLVDEVESPREAEVTQVSESPGEDGSPAVEEEAYRDEEEAKGNLSSAEIKPNVEALKIHDENAELSIKEDSVADLKEPPMNKNEDDSENILSFESEDAQCPSHMSSDAPESLEKKDDPEDLKPVETGKKSQVIDNEATTKSKDEDIKPPESKADGPDSTSLNNDASSQAL